MVAVIMRRFPKVRPEALIDGACPYRVRINGSVVAGLSRQTLVTGPDLNQGQLQQGGGDL